MTGANPITARPTQDDTAPCASICRAGIGDGADGVMAQFVRAILPQDQAQQVLEGSYTEAFHAGLMSRLAALRGSGGTGRRSRVSPLPKWKLRLVEAYVDARLGERITLADLAAEASLSDMHFAAQFRLATGLRPHDYVTHRRIRHARRLLAGTQEPIVQVALAAGFQTQSHFSTVFKKVVGVTPHRWREAERARQAESRAATAASPPGEGGDEGHRTALATEPFARRAA